MSAFDHLEFWKKELRLQDWVVEVKPAKDLGDDCGVNAPSVTQRFADIQVSEQDGEDTEVTLVHELLHCYFPMQDSDEKSFESVRAEQGISAIAELLVRYRRDAEKPRRLANGRGVPKGSAKRKGGRLG